MPLNPALPSARPRPGAWPVPCLGDGLAPCRAARRSLRAETRPSAPPLPPRLVGISPPRFGGSAARRAQRRPAQLASLPRPAADPDRSVASPRSGAAAPFPASSASEPPSGNGAGSASWIGRAGVAAAGVRPPDERTQEYPREHRNRDERRHPCLGQFRPSHRLRYAGHGDVFSAAQPRGHPQPDVSRTLAALQRRHRGR